MTDGEPGESEPLDDELVDAILEHLLEEGALELVSVSEDGEPVYRLTHRCREVLPELYEAHRAEVNEIANSLWQMGVVEISFADSIEGTRVIMSTDNYIKYLSVRDTLSVEQLDFVNSVLGDRYPGYGTLPHP
jgi:hypothetical protein